MLKKTFQNSGIDGNGGWVVHDRRFVNEYYFALLGNVTASTPDQQKVAVSPPWQAVFKDNTGLTENHTGVVLPVPSRYFWRLPVANKKIVMVRVKEWETNIYFCWMAK